MAAAPRADDRSSRIDPARSLGKAAACGVLGVALGGMPLVLVGAFHAVPGLLLSAAVAVVAWWRWRIPLTVPAADRTARLAALAAVALCIVAGGVNARFSGQHLFVERDPGVYAVTGVWLAEHGDLRVATSQEEFGSAPEPQYSADGFHASGRGDYLEPQFMHLSSALLAVGDWLGGLSLLLKVTPLIGALALLAVYLFATTLVRPPLALVAMLALAVALPQVYFTRDTYSEPLAQLLLFSGLWALASADARRSTWRSENFFAGLLLGATTMARIDALFYLVPIGLFLIAEHVFQRATADPPGPGRATAVLAGLSLPVGLGLVDVALYAPFYAEDLAPELQPIAVALAAIALLGAFSRTLVPVARAVVARRRTLALVIGIAVLIAGAIAMAVQPWLGWYLGVPTMVVAVAGLAATAALVVSGRQPAAAPFVLILTLTAAVYVVRPSISPEHIWAMRRFIPVVIPGLLITAVVLLGVLPPLAGRPTRRRLAAAAPAAAAGFVVVVLVAVPTLRVFDVRPQYPAKQITEAVCSRLPADAAVGITGPPAAVLQGSYPLASTFTVTIRAACGVPAAAVPSDPELVGRLAVEVAARGRRLILLSQTPDPFSEAAGSGTQPLIARGVEDLERTADQAPRRIVERPVQVFLTPAPAPAGG